MSLPVIASIIVGVAGALLAFGVIWKVVRYIFKFDRAAPILLTIAEQFQTNGGSTMLDKINTIGTKIDAQDMRAMKAIDELEIQSRLAIKIAEDSRTVAQTNAAIVNELGRDQSTDIQHIKDYMHDKMHQMNTNFATLNLQYKLIDKRNERLEARLDEIIPYIKRHREDYERDE